MCVLGWTGVITATLFLCSLQTRLKETDDQLSSKETTLRGKEEQLRKMEETVTAEKQVYDSYISLL